MYYKQLLSFIAAIIIANAVNKATCQDSTTMANPSSYASRDLQVNKNKATSDSAYNSDSMFFTLGEAGHLNENVMSTSSTIFNNKKRILFGIHDRDAGQTLKLLGIYSRDNVIYFHVEYKNALGKKLEAGNTHLYIHEQYGSKRTGARRVEIKLISVFGKKSILKTAIQDTCIIAVPKFTIPYAKYCEISVNEKDGDDGLSLKIYNDLLESAHTVPE